MPPSTFGRRHDVVARTVRSPRRGLWLQARAATRPRQPAFRDRQRLASALGKNRSFVSQIANPAYTTSIPAKHLETIFDVCHFSQEDRRAFVGDYSRAHRQRPKLIAGAKRLRTMTVTVTVVGNAKRNKVIDDMVAEFARKLARMVDDLD